MWIYIIVRILKKKLLFNESVLAIGDGLNDILMLKGIFVFLYL